MSKVTAQVSFHSACVSGLLVVREKWTLTLPQNRKGHSKRTERHTKGLIKQTRRQFLQQVCSTDNVANDLYAEQN